MPTSIGAHLKFGQEMPWDHYLESPNGLFRAELHGDGQLVIKILNTSTRRIQYLYDSHTPLGADCKLTTRTYRQNINGIYTYFGAAITSPSGDVRTAHKLGKLLLGARRFEPWLAMQDDGNLVLFSDNARSFVDSTETVTPLSQLAIPGEKQVLVTSGTLAVGQGNHVIINDNSDRIVVSDGQTTKVLRQNEAIPASSSGTIAIQIVQWGSGHGNGDCRCDDLTGVVPRSEQVIRV